MKRLYISLALCLVLLAAGIYSLIHVNQARDEVVAQIMVLEGMTGDEPKPYLAELKQLENIWVSHRDRLYHHVHHEKLDEISIELVRAQVHAGQGEFPHMMEALGSMRWLMESVWENEQVRPDNIL